MTERKAKAKQRQRQRQRPEQQQIPCGNDNQKDNCQIKGNCDDRVALVTAANLPFEDVGMVKVGLASRGGWFASNGSSISRVQEELLRSEFAAIG